MKHDALLVSDIMEMNIKSLKQNKLSHSVLAKNINNRREWFLGSFIHSLQLNGYISSRQEDEINFLLETDE